MICYDSICSLISLIYILLLIIPIFQYPFVQSIIPTSAAYHYTYTTIATSINSKPGARATVGGRHFDDLDPKNIFMPCPRRHDIEIRTNGLVRAIILTPKRLRRP